MMTANLKRTKYVGSQSGIHKDGINFVKLMKKQDYFHKWQTELEKKCRIAKVAALQISDDETIAVDGGVLNAYIADFLVNVKNVTIVTDSFKIANQFNLAIQENRMTGEVILIGDDINQSHPTVEEVATLKWLHTRKFDKAFLSCDEFNESIFTTKMIENSYSRILLVDDSKLYRKSFYQICLWNNISQIISNHTCPTDWGSLGKKWTVVSNELEIGII